MEAFKNFVQLYIEVDDREWKVIESSFERKVYAKDEVVLREGFVCRYFYFLECGLVRCFTHHDGVDITRFFTVAPHCFTVRKSFKDQVVSDESIEALDDLALNPNH